MFLLHRVSTFTLDDSSAPNAGKVALPYPRHPLDIEGAYQMVRIFCFG